MKRTSAGTERRTLLLVQNIVNTREEKGHHPVLTFKQYSTSYKALGFIFNLLCYTNSKM